MRQSAAIAVLFYGYKFIKNKKLLSYIVICFIAFLFHKSAIVGLIFYPLYYLKYRHILFLFGIILLAYRLLFVFVSKTFPKYISYIELLDNNSSRYIRIMYALLVIISLAFALYTNTFKQCRGFLNITTVGIVFPFLIGTIGQRFAQYFLVYSILLFPVAVKKIDIKFRMIVMIFFYSNRSRHYI
jgi:hypothetical protein